MSETSWQRFWENGARPVRTLGDQIAPPWGRLGALVFRLHNPDKLYWASRWAPTRIAGCASSRWLDGHPLEKRSFRNPPGGAASQKARCPRRLV